MEGSSLQFTSISRDTKVIDCYGMQIAAKLLMVFFLILFTYACLLFRQWNWSGKRGLCHGRCPGQPSGQRRISDSGRQSDRRESPTAT